MRLTGTLLKAERRNGNFDASDGRNVSYDNWLYRVLDGSEVIEVKVKASDPQPTARPGDSIDWQVNVPEKIKCLFVSEVEASSFA